MKESTKRRIEELGLKAKDFERKPKPSTIEISREDFDLLDVEADETYHIIETDGTVTIKKGVNK